VLTVICAGLAPFAATTPAAADAVNYASSLDGYWSVDAAGHVLAHGDAHDLGDLSGIHLNAPIVGIAATFGEGYWLVAADGGLFTFGDARFYGSTGAMHLNAPIVGMLPSSRGYLLVAADGGVFTFGDAKFLGSTGNIHLNAPVVGIARLGSGYVLAASDGGVFTFGGAPFRGSAGNLHLNAPIVGIASDGRGYRLAASDGGVFAYGAPFSSSSIGTPTSAIATSAFGGYVLQSANGLLSAFGNASSCLEIGSHPSLPVGEDATPARFVGVANTGSASAGDPEGGMAQVRCPVRGNTGAFHAPTGRYWRWRVEVSSPTAKPCFTEVFGLDRVGARPVPTRPLVAKYGRVVMRSTQTAGHSVFDVRVTGTNCTAIATNSVYSITVLPLADTTRVGDIGPFTFLVNPGDPWPSPPFTVHAHGTCTTEVRSSRDGRLRQRKTGSSYTMTVTTSAFYISNSPGCTVSVT
jgi:hypothetical protein